MIKALAIIKTRITTMFRIAVIMLFLLVGVNSVNGANRYSVASGNWNSTSTWSTASGGGSGASVPVAGDNVYIEGADVVTVTANAACTNMSIASGSTLNVGGFTFTVSGTTSVTGSLNHTSTTRTKTFGGLVTISSGGEWNNSINEDIILQGGITNNGTFTAGTGIYTFSSNNQGIIGTLSIPNVTVTGITLTNNGIFTVSSALSGTGGLTQGTDDMLYIGGTSTITTLTATAVGNTVNYTGAAQTAKVTTYHDLTLSGSLAKTFATTPTVNGVLSMEGTATVAVTTGGVTYGALATLQYNTATARNASSEEWITPFAATGGVIIANTGSITLNEPKVFNASVPLTINNGATLATGNFQLTFGGDFINNGGTFSAGSSPIVIAGTATTQNIDGFTTTGAVSMTKTAGTATFTGNVNGASLTINGGGGTLHLGTGLTHTFTGTWTRTAGTLNCGSSTLNLSGGFSGTGGTFTAGAGTVNYNNLGNQTIAALAYNNLTLSGSGTKTVATGASVGGNL
ncbi:MAG: hypothetical protein NT004_11195, partial [Bacteroidetes bacterium]|nr:hypothetical protein [Bacteroidota bacterium]